MDTIDCPYCGNEHAPVGNHEEDSGERECDGCGFKFIVEVEYSPSYSVTCVEHKFGSVLNYMDGDSLVKYVACELCSFAKEVKGE